MLEDHEEQRRLTSEIDASRASKVDLEGKFLTVENRRRAEMEKNDLLKQLEQIKLETSDCSYGRRLVNSSLGLSYRLYGWQQLR